MATTTTNFGWDIPQSTDLVKDGADAIAALGQDIDTALVDLKGGTSGQVLAKASGTDLDFSWVAQDDSNAIQNAIVDAKGDLIAATGADTPARLAVGTDGQVLTADSAESTGLKWSTLSSGALAFITSSTFSSTNAVNIDNCFSSTYENYVIMVNLTNATSTSASDIQLRMRTGGSTNTSSNYAFSTIYNSFNGTTTSEGGTARDSSYMGYLAQNTKDNAVINMQSPYATQNTKWFSNYMGGIGRGGVQNNVYNATTSFDGFSLYVSVGSSYMTGTIRVYGVQN
jgi:hypothetical protein